MTKHEQFIRLVASMREAQRAYDNNRTRSNEAEVKKCETLVDEWLLSDMAEQVQFDLWGRAWMTDEEQGPYNLTDEQHTEEGETT